MHEYWKAYHDDDNETLVQKEFEKLKKEKGDVGYKRSDEVREL